MQKKTQEGVFFGGGRGSGEAEGRRICGGQVGRPTGLSPAFAQRSVEQTTLIMQNAATHQTATAPRGSCLQLLEPSVRPAKSHVCLIQQELRHSEAY